MGVDHYGCTPHAMERSRDSGSQSCRAAFAHSSITHYQRTSSSSKSVFAVLKSLLNTTFVQPTLCSSKSHRMAMTKTHLLSISKARQLQTRFFSFEKTVIDRFNPELVREKCFSKYHPIEFEYSTCEHDSKPTEFQIRTFEAEHAKPHSECME